MKRYFILIMLCCTIAFAQDVPKTPAEYQQWMKEGRVCLMIVNSTPSGATITVDGKAMTPPPGGATANDKTPAVVNLFKKAAPRRVLISLAGYKPVERVVEVNGSPVAIEVTLEPEGTTSNAKSAPEIVPVSAPEKSKAAHSLPTPFGFHYHSSKEEVIKQLGSTAVVKSNATSVTFKAAPSPHPDFELYTAFFSPKQGLLKVVAFSKDIQTSDDGSELISAYERLRTGLEAKYGTPKKLDGCKGSEVDCQPQFYTMQLMQKNRFLSSFWKDSPEDVGVIIEAHALGINKGFIQVTYEFPGWDAFVDELDNKSNSVF